MSIPLNRWSEKDKNQIKIYNMSNPHYYQDKNGDLHPIDQYHSQSKNNSNIGNFKLYEKNINSVGIRSGSNNTTKYLGIRPDETQENGSQQVEWSIENININGNEITPDLSKYEEDGTLINLGNVSVQTSRQYTRQIVNVTGSIDDFQIKYKLNLKGLRIRGNKYTENTTIRNSISESLIDCGNISGSQYSSMMNYQTHSDSILSLYFTDDTLIINPNFSPNPYYNMTQMSSSEFTTNTSSFSIINRDTNTFWGGDNVENDWMSSIYVKDNMLLRFKNINLGNRIKNYILNKYNAEMDGNYIRVKGGKKVGSFVYLDERNTSYLTLAMADITHISSSYRYKDFDDFSYITSSYSDIINDIKTQLKSYNQVTASIGSYIGDSEGRFVLEDNDKNHKYSIVKPILLDSNLSTVTQETIHTLKENEDGTYEYIKYPNKDLLHKTITGSVTYLDSTTLYSEADSDGYIYTTGQTGVGGWSNNIYADTGSYMKTTTQDFLVYCRGASFGKTITYYVSRGFLSFDVSALTSDFTCNSGQFFVRHYMSNAGVRNQLHLFKGTQADSMSINDYSQFQRHSSSRMANFINMDDYSNTGSIFDSEFEYSIYNPSQAVWFSSSLLEHGLLDAASTASRWKMCLTSKSDDDTPYVNDNQGSQGDNGLMSADFTGTDNDPYLLLDVTGPQTPIFKMKSGHLKINSGTITIK